MSYSANDFSVPINISTQPITANLSIFDTNYRALSSHMSNVANAAFALSTTNLVFTNTSISTPSETSLYFDAVGNYEDDVWVSTFQDINASNTLYGASLDKDNHGNVLIFGGDANSNANYILKTSANGNVISQITLSDANSQIYYSDAIFNDVNGNIYITVNDNQWSNGNTHLVKLDSSYNILWQKHLSSYFVQAPSVSVDSTGAVFAFGTIWESGAYKYMYAKFDSSGNILYQYAIEDPTSYAYGNSCAVGPDDNFVIVGTSYNSPTTGIIIKIDGSDGSILWQKRITDDILNLDLQAVDVGISSSNQVYVSLYCTTNYDSMCIISFDSDGTFQWQKEIRSNFNKYPTGIFVEDNIDDRGVYFTGYGQNDQFTDMTYFVLIGKLDLDTGEEIWINQVGEKDKALWQYYNNWDRPIAYSQGSLYVNAYGGIPETNNTTSMITFRFHHDGTGVGKLGPYRYLDGNQVVVDNIMQITDPGLSVSPGSLLVDDGYLETIANRTNYQYTNYRLNRKMEYSNDLVLKLAGPVLFPDGTYQNTAAQNFGDVHLAPFQSATLTFDGGGAHPPDNMFYSGEKLRLWNNSGASVGPWNYAIGIENYNMWFSVDNINNINAGFKWYGQNTQIMKLDTTGRLHLSNVIIFADGSEQNTAGGSANTGSVTFNTNTVQGLYELNLSPDPSFTSNNQYLRLRAGDDPAHIHLDTGDNTIYDQYWGDDNKYIKLERGYSGNVVIGTSGKSWNFDSNGALTFPGPTVLPSTIALLGNDVDNGGMGQTLDLTKQIQYLDATGASPYSNYYLADGREGQIMYFVAKTDAEANMHNIVVNCDHMRYRNGTSVTAPGDWLPFWDVTTPNGRTMGIGIFIDGAWSFDGGDCD